MKLLLDTHLLLWAAGQAGRLSTVALKLINDDGNQLLFSTASLWEVATKSNLGRDDCRIETRLLRRGLIDNGYTELAISSEHAVSIDLLQALHKDPFDRILVSQAMIEGITLLTTDPQVAQYPGPIRLV